MPSTPTRLLLACACAAWLSACSSAATDDGAGASTADVGLFGDVSPLDTVSAFVDADGSQEVGAGDASEDIGPTTYGFGWPCVSDDECHSGYCLLPGDGDTGFCTQLCQQDCPDGYLCQNQPAFGPVVFLCVPLEKVGCQKPCFHPWTFQGCGVPGALCALVDEEPMCLDACTTDAECPDDFTCKEVLDEGGFALGQQCWPLSDSCLCASSVDVSSDPLHCGACGNACAYEHASSMCHEGECSMGVCEPGWVDLDGEPSNGCEYACVLEEGEDLPDLNLVDTNCDGIDGNIEGAVFVEPGGIDLNNDDGTRDYPFQTIHAALEFASQTPERSMVLVAAGTYKGTVALVAGVHLAGGYEADGWSRDPDLHSTIVLSDAPGPSGAIRAMTADMIVEPTRVTGLVIRTANNPVPGGVIQAMWVRNCGSVLEISDNVFEPGDGGMGVAGFAGIDGFDGVDGGLGESGGTENWWNPAIVVGGGPGGSSLCSQGIDAGGGKGGSAGWGDDPFWDDEVDALPGEASPAGVAGGPAGGTKEAGGIGVFGDDGDNGVDGAGGQGLGSLDALGNWWPSHGADGEPGHNGAGGGGGGGGGGGKGTGAIINEHAHGGGGGGGGSGGCGGSAGGGGTGGGASIGLFIIGSGPTVLSNAFTYGAGGDGGAGGTGGSGGDAGYGGEPGTGYGTAGDGGWGGKAGDGGRGGHGGGGGGGPSFAIYIATGAVPLCEDNGFQGKPLPGKGGPSSANGGQPGDSGKAGPETVPSCDPSGGKAPDEKGP